MRNYLFAFIMIAAVVLGGISGGQKELSFLAPKSHFSKTILENTNGIYRILDSYQDRVEVREQSKMLRNMKDWLYEVNKYITSPKTPHNTLIKALSEPELSRLERRHENLYWRKATDISFAENVRNPFVQQTLQDKFQFENEGVQTIHNQENYLKNQAAVRREIIYMVTDILEGRLTKGGQLRTRLATIHKILLLGEKGDTPYFPITLLRSRDGKQDLAELEDIAGRDTGFHRHYDFERLLFILQEFLKQKDITRRDTRELADVYSRFIRLDSEYGFVNIKYMFKFGNNSLFMNLINTMLNLKNIPSVSHYHFDFKSIVLPSYYHKFFAGFLAEDLSVKEVMDAFFQMALYRNMDELYFKELFKACVFRLKWLRHSVDFSYTSPKVFQTSA